MPVSNSVSKYNEGVEGRPLALIQRSEAGGLSFAVTDALTNLGWGSQVERFLNLLQAAQVKTTDDLLSLTEAQCSEKKLPWDMVCAVQQRVLKYKIEETDPCLDQLANSEAVYCTPHGKAFLKRQLAIRNDSMGTGDLIPESSSVLEHLLSRKMKAQEDQNEATQHELKELRNLVQALEDSVDKNIHRIEQMDMRMEQARMLLKAG